jgi:hypothetical protein
MLNIKIRTQPDDSTCGPTSLHAVYKYYGDKISLQEVISQVRYFDKGGTLAVFLGSHALARGYNVKIYTYNLNVFDPSWFSNNDNLVFKLKEQLKYKKNTKLHLASAAYLEFLNAGGKILFEELTPFLFKKYFEKKVPILTGLSATYLYRSKREFTTDSSESVLDDVKGYPAGHFVVLCGYDEEKRHIVIADPYIKHEFQSNYYSVKVDRLINSIMLGIVTYDSILVIIEPKEK